MPAERVPMRQAREIIRLKFSSRLATREIARRLGLAPSTVRETLSRLASAGLSWPLREGVSDAELRRRFMPTVEASEDIGSTRSRIGRRRIAS